MPEMPEVAGEETAGETMGRVLEGYYANNARKLRRVVDRILLKFGGLYNKDRDDFYSLANEVFVDAMRRHDGRQSFDGFLYSCLKYKILSEMTRRNRGKRKADRMALSLDAPVGDEEGCTLGELIADSFDMEEEAFGELDVIAFKLECYLKRLSKRQKKVLELLSLCYKAEEIRKMLYMTQKEYTDALAGIRSYENIKILL